MYVPGRVLLGKTIENKGFRIVTALAIGMALNVGLFMIAQNFDQLLILIVPIIGFNIYWFAKGGVKKEDFAYLKGKALTFYKNNTATINAAAIMIIIIAPNLILNFQAESLGVIKDVDNTINNLYWQIGRTEMFKAGFPSPDWSLYALNDVAYKYQYLMHLWLAEMSKILGVTTTFLYVRFLQYFLVIACFLATLSFAEILTKNKKKAMLGAFLGTIGAGASFILAPACLVRYGFKIESIYALGHTNYFDWILLSPTTALGVFFFFIALGLLHVWNKENSTRVYILYLFMVLALLASKGSNGLVFIAGLSVYSLLYFDKKFLTRITIPSVVVFAIGYALVFMGYSDEAVMGQELGFYSFKITTWLSDSVTGLEMYILLGGYLIGTIGIKALSVLNVNKQKISKLMKVGFVVGTLFYIVSPIKFVNFFWPVPFNAAAGILIADYALDMKKHWIKKALIVIIFIEIVFGASILLNGGTNGFSMDGITTETYVEENEYETYAYIEENTSQDSVIWTMMRGEDRTYIFNCMAICKRQNLLEGWGFSRYIGDWKYFTDEQKEGHFVQEILDDEAMLLTSEDLNEINTTLDKYDYVDYLIYPLEEATNKDVFEKAEDLEEFFRNEKFIIYEYQ